MIEYLRQFFDSLIPVSTPAWISLCLLCAFVAVIAVVSYYLVIYALRLAEIIISKTPTTWDDDLLNDRILRAISQLAPAIVVNGLLPSFIAHTPNTVRILSTVTSFYILWAAVHIFTVFIDNLYHAFLRRRSLRAYAVKGFFQMFKIVIICVGVIIALSMIIGKTPLAILTALGASAAILSLVFKDTILGLVASVQLTANRMLHKGDWIVVPGTDANGEVTDISLTTIKVRNWDNSVTTVPPYTLITGSFKNYRPMQLAGARRVDRSIYIDITTVRRLDAEETADLREKGYISSDSPVTSDINLALFRAFIENFLRSRKDVRQDCTLMVRQLEPTPSGLPIQLYFFLGETQWVPYEALASSIMDEVYASTSAFSLRLFQTPSGLDLRSLKH